MTTRPPRAEPVLRGGALALLLLLLAACATRPPSPGPSPVPSPSAPAEVIVAPGDAGDRIARRALAELGRPYRYGGDGRDGFDCSGLTAAVHGSEGIALPRTAAAQFVGGKRIAREALRPGDLVFFRFARGAIDHVGVYIGDGQFVHAPSSGDVVRRGSLDNTAYARRYAGAARWWRD